MGRNIIELFYMQLLWKIKMAIFQKLGNLSPQALVMSPKRMTYIQRMLHVTGGADTKIQFSNQFLTCQKRYSGTNCWMAGRDKTSRSQGRKGRSKDGERLFSAMLLNKRKTAIMFGLRAARVCSLRCSYR